MTRVLVTGATGLVGRFLVQDLVSDGVEVIAAVRNVSQLVGSPGVVAATQLDLASPVVVDRVWLRNVDVVYHLAARVHVMRGNPQENEAFHLLNVAGTSRLAKLAAEEGVRRFVFVSSIKVNGERTTDKAFSADDYPAPEDAYARSKEAAERALWEIANSTGMEVSIVRPPLVYGPGVRANFLRLLQLANLGVPLPLGAVRNRRSFVNVWNLVSLVKCIASHPRAANKVWLVSDGDDVSTPQLLQLIGTALGRKVRLLNVPVEALRLLARVIGRSAEVNRLVESLQVDIASTQEILGWFPPISLKEGLLRTVNWFKGASCDVG